MWQVHAPLWGWAIASILLGLGFTFFSGATEAWLVDALTATGFTGHLEHVFGRAQTVSGAAMLFGTVAGGVAAQATNLGVPYLIRAAMLGVTLSRTRFWSILQSHLVLSSGIVARQFLHLTVRAQR